MSAIAIIPAKGASARLPGKNIKIFHGKPLIAYSIEAAKTSGLFDQVIVSTDSPDVAEIASDFGAKAMGRPEYLLGDEYGPLDVAREVVRELACPFTCCVIYATAPMLLPDDLLRGWTDLVHHHYAISINSDPDKPLQDAGMFIWAAALLDRVPLYSYHTALVPIPKERVCDINTLEDFHRAEKMYEALCG